MDKIRAIPRMFHRRLVLLAVSMTLVVLVLVGQMAVLSIAKGAENLERAKASLQRRTLLPTFRGSIIDRHGRVLAVDRPGYALAVRYTVISGEWQRSRARRAARDEIGSAWATMSVEAREAATDARMPEFERRTERLWEAICAYGAIDDATLHDRLAAITDEIETLAGHVWKRQRAVEMRRLGIEDETYDFREQPILEQRQAHPVLPLISDEVAFAFRSLATELPDMIEVQDARRREYPWLDAEYAIDRTTLPRPIRSETPVHVPVIGIADHILGTVRDVEAEDVRRRPFRGHGDDDTRDLGGYLSIGDTAGARGLERAFERTLRGERGQVRLRLDTREEDVDPAVPGADLLLTLDVALQGRVQALLSPEVGLTVVQPYHQNLPELEGRALNSAAVVLEVESGEILAMVSVPTIAMGAGRAISDPDRARIDYAFVNRPAEAVYPPGSIIKPLVLNAAVAAGKHALSEPIECTGHYLPNVTTHARCWIYREQYNFANHGPLGPEDAIGKSCNIYFYTLADRLGLDGLTDWCRRFGLGQTLDTGLPYTIEDPKTGAPILVGGHPGHLLSDEQIAKTAPANRRFDAISMGIGQGRAVTWTPLQAANAFATMARGGRVRDATIIADGREREHQQERTTRPDLPLDPKTVAASLEGLRRSVSEGGTGYRFPVAENDYDLVFNAEHVTVWGKTGTAQAPPLLTRDTNEDGKINSKDDGIEGLDHAWFVGLVGPNDTRRPMFAIAVIVEYGGSGGRVAGPIANQIIRALQDEGYLPGASLAAAGGGGGGGVGDRAGGSR